MRNEIVQKAAKVWKTGDPGSALSMLEELSLAGDAEAIFLEGEIRYSRQEWGAALNCFRKCLQLRPEWTAAQTYADLIQNILGFFHTDQFNP